MEVDSGLEVVSISEATGPLLYRSDFRIQPFRNSIGDAMSEVGQDIGQVVSIFGIKAPPAFGVMAPL